jgi:Beta-propeller repeat
MKDHSAPRARGVPRTLGITFLSLALVAAAGPWVGSWMRGIGALRHSNGGPLEAAVPPSVGAKLSGNSRAQSIYVQLPLSFETNAGQADPTVKFLSRGEGYALFLTGDSAVLALKKGSPDKHMGPANRRRQISAAVLRMNLAGANPRASVSGLDELPGKSNYFVGNDPSKWRTGVANYARVRYQKIYPGIDVIYYGNQRELEYDFVVKPGADPRAIALRFSGADEAAIDSLGNLVLNTKDGNAIFHKPVIYQAKGGNRQEVAGSFDLGRGPSGGVQEVRFRLGDYDRSRELVIDPTLSYSSYLGGTQDDFGNAIALDASGNAYITGQTLSTNFPTLSSYQTACSSCSTFSEPDVFVSKVNSSGSALLFSTYIGGNYQDSGNGIAVDANEYVFVAGTTSSSDFPVLNAFQSTSGGPTTPGVPGDAFVLKLNPSGSSLAFSSYLGGSAEDDAYGIAVDKAGEAYVVGHTESTNFPLEDAYQTQNNGSFDVFVTKVAGSGSSLVYSTYLGGAAEDDGYAIAVDSSENAYITGQTLSNNFPTAAAYQAAYGGTADAFVSKLSFSGSKLTLAYSTYLGGSSTDQGFGIALDSSNNAYITGLTSSTNFPTANPYQGSFQGGSSDAFLSKLSSNGTTLTYSTYLGGSSTDSGRGVAVDSTGHAHVVGYTSSSNFPTANPVQSTYAGNQDGFLSRVSPTGCGLIFSTYLGGKSTDIANGVAADSSGDSYVTGSTLSNDFPTEKPFQAITGGNNDAFIVKVGSGTAPTVCLSPASLNFAAETSMTSSEPMTSTLTNDGNATLDITSITASGPYTETNTCGSSLNAGANCTLSVTFSPTSAGNLGGAVTITDNAAGVSGVTQNVVLSGTGTDFSLSVTPSSVSVMAGQTATYTITLQASSKFTDTVSLTCNGDPSPGACSISPTSITPTGGSNATATLTASTVATGITPPGGTGGFKSPFLWLVAILGCGLLGVATWARRTGRARVWSSVVTAAGFALLVTVWFGCGVSNPVPTRTLPGNYPLTITGTAGSLTHSVSATLSVQ